MLVSNGPRLTLRRAVINQGQMLCIRNLLPRGRAYEVSRKNTYDRLQIKHGICKQINISNFTVLQINNSPELVNHLLSTRFLAQSFPTSEGSVIRLSALWSGTSAQDFKIFAWRLAPETFWWMPFALCGVAMVLQAYSRARNEDFCG